jgi:hypothetical protein
MGNQPVSVHLHRRGETVEVTVASDLTDSVYEGVVTVSAPLGWAADPSERPIRLLPGGWTRFAVDLVAGPDATGGVVTARLDHAGSTVEDILVIGAEPSALTATLDRTRLGLRPGQCETLTLRLRNTTGYAIYGEVQTISPWGTWAMLRPYSQAFRVEAQGQATLPIDVTVPVDAAAGAWWVLAKLMWFGSVSYTAATSIEVIT